MWASGVRSELGVSVEEAVEEKRRKAKTESVKKENLHKGKENTAPNTSGGQCPGFEVGGAVWVHGWKAMPPGNV